MINERMTRAMDNFVQHENVLIQRQPIPQPNDGYSLRQRAGQRIEFKDSTLHDSRINRTDALKINSQSEPSVITKSILGETTSDYGSSDSINPNDTASNGGYKRRSFVKTQPDVKQGEDIKPFFIPKKEKILITQVLTDTRSR